ncbi:MAG: transcriptional regulator [Candidatus Izimaplasma sp.]|nr:transcriptional regulator [Candidatus Izimaplasma bacterium]
MELSTVLELLNAKQYNLECPRCIKEINYAFVCDLMSDALMLLKQMPSYIGAHGALVTGLVTNQALRTAEILDLETIIFVRGKTPSQSVIDLADEIGITLIGTKLTMYKTSGLLFVNGIKSYESVLEEQ